MGKFSSVEFSRETPEEMTGTTRSRVSVFMNRFHKLGYIEYNGNLDNHNSLLNVVLYDKERCKQRAGTLRLSAFSGRDRGSQHTMCWGTKTHQRRSSNDTSSRFLSRTFFNRSEAMNIFYIIGVIVVVVVVAGYLGVHV
jgi:hypothetical protein